MFEAIPLEACMSTTATALVESGAKPHDDPFSRPDQEFKHHRNVLAIACGVCLLALLLQEVPGGRVALRGLPQFPLPQACASRIWLGLGCPGCGLTRSIIHLAQGDWQASWRAHRLGGLFALVIAFQIPYRLYALRRPALLPLSNFWLAAFGYALIVTLVMNWLWDLAAGRLTSP
jgi:hypothetical protein